MVSRSDTLDSGHQNIAGPQKSENHWIIDISILYWWNNYFFPKIGWFLGLNLVKIPKKCEKMAKIDMNFPTDFKLTAEIENSLHKYIVAFNPL